MKKNIEFSRLRYLIYIFVALSLLYSVFLLPNIARQKPFSDDWFMLEIARELYNKPFTDWITVKDPFNQWRPLPFIFKAIYLKGKKCDLIFYNSFKLSIFVGIIVLIYFTSIIFLKDKEAAFLSALFFLVNPTIIGAVQNIDHIFKLTGTLFYGITIVFMYLSFVQERRKIIYIIVCIFSYIIGFISDADTIATFPAIFLVALFGFRNRNISLRKTAVIIATSLLVVASYLYLRNIIVGGAFSGGLPGKQDIVLSFNILYNCFKLLISSLIFTVSPYIYFKKSVYIISGVFFIILNVSVISFAIFKCSNKQRGKLFLLLCLSFIAMIPFVFIRHVSEIYSFRPAYLLMIVLAYSYVLLYKISRQKLMKCAVAFLLVLILVSGAFSQKIKQEMMLQRGLMAEEMVISMIQLVPNPQPFSTINLNLNDCGVKDTYSDFVNNDIQLVGGFINLFVRYNYGDETLNSGDNPISIYNLKWDCNKRQFLLLSKAENVF